MYKVVEHDGHTDFGPEHWKRAYENLNHYKHPAEYINMHQLLGQYQKYVKLRQRCRDITFFVKLKYNLLQQTLNGPFNTPHNIDTLISLFEKSQRTYLSFARFAQLWKVKHSQLRIEIDLCLNPIIETDANTTTIYQCGSRYKFKISDLMNVCNTALLNSNTFFSEPLVPKNPYTNLDFTYPILYKIYNLVRHSNYRMPLLLHLFYVSDFDIESFLQKNEAVIRYEYIIDYTKHGEDNELVKWVPDMLVDTNMHKTIVIHKEFPKSVLIQAMRPFLKEYFISQYSLYKTSEKRRTFSVLKYKLKKFKELSHRFGRQMLVHIKNSCKFKRAYYTDFVSYHQISMDDFDEVSSDSDDESDSEEIGMTDETNPYMQSTSRIQSLLESLSMSMINATYRNDTSSTSENSDNATQLLSENSDNEENSDNDTEFLSDPSDNDE
jgi:hypothetical protein